MATTIEGVLVAVVVLAALGFIAAAGVVALSRLLYPFPIEWMEGGVVLQVNRVLRGQSLYVEPSVDFTPFIYPPLYFYVSAGVAALTGPGFLPARLVSIGSTAGSFIVIWYLVHRETGSRLASLAAGGFFAACYPLVGTWFDLARVDMLFLFLSLLGIAVIRVGRHPRWAVAAGVLFALGVLAKQSALVVLGPVAVYALWYRRKFGTIFIAVSTGLIGASTAFLQTVTDGWYLYYIVRLPMKHELVEGRLVSFWTADLLPPAFIAAAFAGGYIVSTLRGAESEAARFYPIAVAGLVGAAWQARIHQGGWMNALIPAYAGLAILFGLGMHRARSVASHVAERFPPLPASAIRALVLTLVLIQFATLGYAPGDHVPSASDRRRGEETQRAIDGMPSPVFAPTLPFVAARAGHKPVAHKMALVDVLRAPSHDAQAALRSNITRTMQSQRYRVLLYHHRHLPLANFTYGYEYSRPFLSARDRWRPLTGVYITPGHVFVPANRSSEAANESMN